MSAYQVEDETINRVVTWLIEDRDARGYLAEVARATETDANSEGFAETLALSMHLLNVDALRYRYEDADAAGMIVPFLGFRRARANKTQVCKSLACWLYQCSEGEFANRPLYRAMDKLKGWLAYDIVSSLPEYAEAQWA